MRKIIFKIISKQKLWFVALEIAIAIPSFTRDWDYTKRGFTTNFVICWTKEQNDSEEDESLTKKNVNFEKKLLAKKKLPLTHARMDSSKLGADL